MKLAVQAANHVWDHGMSSLVAVVYQCLAVATASGHGNSGIGGLLWHLLVPSTCAIEVDCAKACSADSCSSRCPFVVRPSKVRVQDWSAPVVNWSPPHLSSPLVAECHPHAGLTKWEPPSLFRKQPLRCYKRIDLALWIPWAHEKLCKIKHLYLYTMLGFESVILKLVGRVGYCWYLGASLFNKHESDTSGSCLAT